MNSERFVILSQRSESKDLHLATLTDGLPPHDSPFAVRDPFSVTMDRRAIALE